VKCYTKLVVTTTKKIDIEMRKRYVEIDKRDGG